MGGVQQQALSGSGAEQLQAPRLRPECGGQLRGRTTSLKGHDGLNGGLPRTPVLRRGMARPSRCVTLSTRGPACARRHRHHRAAATCRDRPVRLVRVEVGVRSSLVARTLRRWRQRALQRQCRSGCAAVWRAMEGWGRGSSGGAATGPYFSRLLRPLMGWRMLPCAPGVAGIAGTRHGAAGSARAAVVACKPGLCLVSLSPSTARTTRCPWRKSARPISSSTSKRAPAGSPEGPGCPPGAMGGDASTTATATLRSREWSGPSAPTPETRSVGECVPRSRAEARSARHLELEGHP